MEADNWKHVAVRNRALWEPSMLEVAQFAVGRWQFILTLACRLELNLDLNFNDGDAHRKLTAVG